MFPLYPSKAKLRNSKFLKLIETECYLEGIRFYMTLLTR